MHIQDEEDRDLAMKILGSAGAKKLTKDEERKLRKEQGQVGSKKKEATGAQGKKPARGKPQAAGKYPYSVCVAGHTTRRTGR